MVGGSYHVAAPRFFCIVLSVYNIVCFLASLWLGSPGQCAHVVGEGGGCESGVAAITGFRSLEPWRARPLSKAARVEYGIGVVWPAVVSSGGLMGEMEDLVRLMAWLVCRAELKGEHASLTLQLP